MGVGVSGVLAGGWMVFRSGKKRIWIVEQCNGTVGLFQGCKISNHLSYAPLTHKGRGAEPRPDVSSLSLSMDGLGTWRKRGGSNEGSGRDA